VTVAEPQSLPPLDTTFDVAAGEGERFGRDGHAVIRSLARRDEVAAYRPVIEDAAMRHVRETRPLEERDTYGKAFLQIPNLWRRDEGVRRFTLARRFGQVAADLLGVDGVRLYHDQALFKEPAGGRTPWHQDQFYWPLDTDRTITMWMPLVDVPPEVGSMTFVSGSQREGYLGDFGISDESDDTFAAMIEEHGLRVETHGALAAGDATFHAGWTLHCAPANPTANMRPVMTVIYVADGARVAEPRSPFQEFDLKMWLPGLAPGDLVDTEKNPLVWSHG
jgi:ectoine hydroxylase-related dioxygenase (phytanoyl-CoA dioxygenase family)